MSTLRLRTLASTFALTALAGAVQPAWALPISQQPLVLPSQIKPAFIMSLDNSGSIGSDETLCKSLQGECAYLPTKNGVQGTFFNSSGGMLVDGQTVNGVTTTDYFRVMRGSNGTHGGHASLSGTDTQDGGTGNNDDSNEVPRVDIFGAARDVEFNRAYFDPTAVYSPWVNFDASNYQGSCAGASGCTVGNNVHQVAQTTAPAFNIGDSVVSAAPEDPRHINTSTDGITGTTIDFTRAALVTYAYSTGDTLPAGTRWYYSSTTTAQGPLAATTTTLAGSYTLSCPALKASISPAPANGTVETLASAFTMTTACTVTTQYYPGTYYLTTNTGGGAGFIHANIITVPNAGPLGAPLYKYEIIPANFSTAAAYNTELQNFANYWTYYADRARAIVAAATQAFEGVDFMRVGKFDISPICASAGNCSPLTSSSGYTRYIAGPDTNYTSQPAGDPLVSMFDMSDYCYNSAVTINPTIPVSTPAPCQEAGGGDRSKLYAEIYAFDRPNNNTPTRRAVFRLGHQFQRPIVPASAGGVTDTNPPVLLECQANAGMLFTDGYINDDNGGMSSSGSLALGNVDAGVVDVGGANNVGNAITGFGTAPFTDSQNGSNAGTMADITAYYYQEDLNPALPKGRVPTAAGCPNKQLDCNPNLHMQFYGIPLGAQGRYYDVSPYIDNLSTPQDEATQEAFVISPTWQAKGLANNASGTTDLSPDAVDDIWHASINSRGKFISAQSPAAVKTGIQTVINSLLAASLPSGSLPVTGVRLGAGSLSYEPSFKKAGSDWTGDVVATAVNSDGSLATSSTWDAQSKLQALSNASRDARSIFIDTQAGGAAGHITSQFGAAYVSALGTTANGQLTFLGLVPAAFHAAYGASTGPTDVVNYLMGDSSNETNVGGVFRSRSAILGDIINSAPAISNGTDDFGFGLSLPSALGGGSVYNTFVATKTASRTPKSMLYVGANDGMLHAIDATTTGGNELWSFIPNSVAGKLGLLIDPNYVHNFYEDGPNTVFDAYLSGAWKTVLVGTPGAGGSGVYALDVSSPSSFGTANVMWDLTGASDPDIGANIGAPLVILGEDSNWYAAFGNGYNSTNANPALILVNLSTGVITAKLVGNDGGTFDNGIGQIAAIDSDGDGKVDTIYGGDYLGNMWKFDLSSTSSSSWTVANGGTPLYVAKDSLGNPQPITGGIELGDGPVGGSMVYFGTGSFFLTTDNTVASPALIQTLYGVWDNGTADTVGRGPVTVPPAAPNSGGLQEQTITAQTSGTLTSRALSANPVNYNTTASSQRGFYVDLVVGSGPGDGEKFFGTPLVENGTVFFTSFEPSGDQCQPGGNNWGYVLDALSGSAAASNLSYGSLSCGSSCGAVLLGSGSPIRSTAVVVPPPAACIPGLDAGCPIPAENCSSGTCVPNGPSDSSLFSPCTIVLRVAGNPPPAPITLPRACGRQSWRQVR